MGEVFISDWTVLMSRNKNDVINLYNNAGKSFKNALNVIGKGNYVNFKNYDYFYELTYRYVFNVRKLLNDNYMNFIYYVVNNGKVSIKGDSILVYDAEKYIKEFIHQGDTQLMLKRRAAMIGILDLLSGSPKPGKFAI